MNKPEIDPANIRHVILDTTGATCSNCTRALEHVGRKLNGVVSLRVDRAASSIDLAYDGRPETIDAVINLVVKLGYDARRRT